MVCMIFKPAARYPADPRAVFILACSVFTGLVALALRVGPATLEENIPEWGLIVWGATLLAGSAATLVGMTIQSINGIITEQIGSVMVGTTTIFYAILALSTSGVGSIQIVGVVLAWGLACLVRWGQLQALVNQTYRETVREQAVKAVLNKAQDQ